VVWIIDLEADNAGVKIVSFITEAQQIVTSLDLGSDLWKMGCVNEAFNQYRVALDIRCRDYTDLGLARSLIRRRASLRSSGVKPLVACTWSHAKRTADAS
jgi:hypothetical protein